MGDKEMIDQSNKHLTDAEVRSHSRRGSSSDSSSFHFDIVGNNDDENFLDKSQQPGLKPAATPPGASTDQSTTNQTPATAQAPPGYDPSRIPPVIFSTRPATPTDWSISSNESLFSIHVGNSSFSKDQLFMLHKSGELAKYDEQIIAHSGLPPLSKVHNNYNNSKATRNENIEKSNTTTMDVGAVADKKMPENQAQSPVSDRGTLSFAFPVLVGEISRSSSLHATENKESGTQSTNQPQPEAQPHNPAVTQDTSCSSWFSFFFCCHCSCFL